MAERPMRGVASPEPTLTGLLADPAASFAVKTVARRWAGRDCVDAAIDARVLCDIFEAAAERMIGGVS